MLVRTGFGSCIVLALFAFSHSTRAAPPVSPRLDCDVEESKLCVVRVNVREQTIVGTDGRTYQCTASSTVERVGARDSNDEVDDKMLIVFMLMYDPAAPDRTHVYRFSTGTTNKQGIEIKDNSGTREDFVRVVGHTALNRQLYMWRVKKGKAVVPTHDFEIYVERKSRGMAWPANPEKCWGGDPIIANDN